MRAAEGSRLDGAVAADVPSVELAADGPPDPVANGEPAVLQAAARSARQVRPARPVILMVVERIGVVSVGGWDPGGSHRPRDVGSS